FDVHLPADAPVGPEGGPFEAGDMSTDGASTDGASTDGASTDGASTDGVSTDGATPSEPSCRPAADLPVTSGLTDCGPNANESCCASLVVDGGRFARDEGHSAYATVSTFRLDRFEVTVGRFRRFVTAVRRGWSPDAGAGKHFHLDGGRGLRNI